MASQKPIVVGDVYDLGGVSLLKITVTNQGEPVSGISPHVTIIRDSDHTAANFTTEVFDPFTLTSITQSQYSAAMTEVAFGTYFYEFDPTDFDSGDEQVYTVIYHHSVPPNPFVIHSEFTFTGAFGAKSKPFGLLRRCMNVCTNTPFRIGYQALSGIGVVRMTIYNPYDEIVVADVPMQELGQTGIYLRETQLSLQGDHLIHAWETTNGSRDSMILTVGGNCDRLKRIEQMLRELTQNPPTVNPCGVDPCAQ